jgi:tetratricopeptide (TPR) repeat protein
MIALDEGEYFQLALHASSVGDHHACLMYLRKVLQKRPCDPWALYLRATQHAELGLTERAIDGIETALSIEPRIEVARLQLSLLLLRMNRPAEAKQHLAAFGNSTDPALRVFGDVLIALADNDPCLARKKLAANLPRISQCSPFHALMLCLRRELVRSKPDITVR